jgi:hypothetical protein
MLSMERLKQPWNNIIHTLLSQILSTGSYVESKCCHFIMVEADSHLKLLHASILDITTKCLSTLICCPWEYSSSLTQLYPHYLVQILGFWVTFGVEMMSLRHGWGWQPPQTVSPIHVRYIQSVWAHWYVVHGNTLTALHSYTHITYCSDFGGFWVLGHFWSWNDVNTSWLRLTATSNCFPHQS